MKFKESYIRKIIQEEIGEVSQPKNEDFSNQESESEIIEIGREEMVKMMQNVNSLREDLKDSVSSTETRGMKALDDLDKLHTWFDVKLTGGGEEPEWSREPSEEELEFLDKHFWKSISGGKK